MINYEDIRIKKTIRNIHKSFIELFKEKDYEKIIDFCKKSGKSFSETVREASLKYVEEMENKDHSDFLKENYPFASAEEEDEIAEILKSLKEE